MRRFWILAAGLAIALGGVASAHATFAGKNGLIAFETNRAGNADIAVMNADGSGRIDLTNNPAEDIQPRWSPDGTRIAFASNRSGDFEIYTMDASGGDLRRITFMPGSVENRPAWTSGGGLVFTSYNGGQPDLYSVNADGSGLTDLTPDVSYEAFPAPSPRGGKLVYTSDRANDGDYHLWLQEPGSSTPRQITFGSGSEDFEANWSPTGSNLVFVRFDPTFSSSDLYVVRANGTGLRRLTSTPGREEFEPSWSPDGSEIVFHACADDGSHCAVYVVSADGSGETDLSVPHVPFLDDFSSSSLNQFWSTQVVGSGPSVQQANGVLEMDLPASTTVDPGRGYAQPAVFSQCNLRGDFDMRADYTLLQWPEPDSVNADFTEGNFVGGAWQSANGIFVNRWGLASNFPPLPSTFIPNPPSSGTLRLTRTGSTLSASYFAAGGWVTVQTRDDLVADESDATLDVFDNAAAGSNGEVRVAFDNFEVTSGTFSCPTWWDDNAPDWQAR